MKYCTDFTAGIRYAESLLMNEGEEVDAGRWQGVPTQGKRDLVTREVRNVTFTCPTVDNETYFEGPNGNLPGVIEQLENEIKPNLPWAEDHFWERVGRNPTNPGHTFTYWPWWRGQNDLTMKDGMFSHTYQERFWPKEANGYVLREGKVVQAMHNQGIRYELGDLDDMIELLYREPYTRQAYLPIFFPEDTGATHGGRIPCTLGYQFMLRGRELHMWYFIRSCDFIRHFRDDIYLAARLQLWVLQELVEKELADKQSYLWNEVAPGDFTMFICSLHYHLGDQHYLDTAPEHRRTTA